MLALAARWKDAASSVVTGDLFQASLSCYNCVLSWMENDVYQAMAYLDHLPQACKYLKKIQTSRGELLNVS